MSSTLSSPSRRTLLAAGAAGAATALLGAGPAAAADLKPTAAVRVLTYNIHHGASGAEVFDLERVAEVIEAVRPDIVGLQEVDRHWSARSQWLDLPEWFSERLGMRYVYGANLDLDPLVPGDPRRQYGTAILTPWPVKSSSNTLLPKLGTHEQRGLLQAEIEVNGSRVRFANTHLQHNDAFERQLQAARIRELLGDDADRTILVGDLNAVPGTPEMLTMTGFLKDAWTEAGSGDGYTHDSEHPHARIDYVMHSSDVRAESAAVIMSDPLTSDHLPVAADLRVDKGRF
ncbi:endonuclease/exonuclease/phosphatase family protein [Streptomyces sp. NPDC059909]|uniref:endonuclease/exonuclease/phosphatase family protein n=1 Tax=Streptomyces sp. NPDC059909 TaxID=3346998 RepID=UPI00364AC20E